MSSGNGELAVLQRLNKWRALTGAERRMLLRLVWILPLVDGGLRLFGLARCQRLLDAIAPPVRPEPCKLPPDLQRRLADRTARLVAIVASNGFYKVTCLRQAISVCWLLRRRGMAAELRIGVRKMDDGLEAHAWVEHAGHVLDQDAHAAAVFAALDMRPLSKALSTT